MKIIPASVEIISPVDGEAILKHIERCGRVCYKSEGKITEGSWEKPTYKHCHECGAKMDLEVDGDG